MVCGPSFVLTLGLPMPLEQHSFAEVWGTRLVFVDCVMFSLERLVINEKAKTVCDHNVASSL